MAQNYTFFLIFRTVISEMNRTLILAEMQIPRFVKTVRYDSYSREDYFFFRRSFSFLKTANHHCR